MTIPFPNQFSDGDPDVKLDPKAEPSVPADLPADLALREVSRLRLHYAGLAYFLSGFSKESESTKSSAPKAAGETTEKTIIL